MRFKEMMKFYIVFKDKDLQNNEIKFHYKLCNILESCNNI